MTDREILDILYTDEAEGFTLLVRTYADIIYEIVCDILQDCSTEEIEECVADSFTAFYNNIDDVDLSRGNIKGYLAVIARRRAVNLYCTIFSADTEDFEEYTVEEMSSMLEDKEAEKYPELSEAVLRTCLKEIAPQVLEEKITQADEEVVDETEEFYEESANEPTVEIIEKSSGFGRGVKTLVAMVSLVLVIVVGVIAFDRLSVPKYVPPTTQATTQNDPFNPLFSAISAGNEKLIEQLITNSLLLSQDVLKYAVEYADKISYDSIRRIAEEVKNKYGSTGLDPLIESAIFGDIQSVEEELKNKDESEMTPAEKLAMFFITTFSGQSAQ